MKLEGEFVFQGTPEEVWEAILDPKVLAVALPGAKKMEKSGEDEYDSEMEIRVGPVTGVFTGKVVLRDKVFPKSYSMVVEGKGGPGFAKGTSRVDFTPQPDGSTLMKYAAEVEVGGRLASVGQRLLDTVGKSMCRQSLTAVNDALKERLAAGGAEVKYAAPSQAKFAFGVMKDVLRSHYLVWLIPVIILVALWLFIRMLLGQ